LNDFFHCVLIIDLSFVAQNMTNTYVLQSNCDKTPRDMFSCLMVLPLSTKSMTLWRW